MAADGIGHDLAFTRAASEPGARALPGDHSPKPSPAPMTRWRVDERGVTLIEILVALAIAAALLALVSRLVVSMTGSGTRTEVMHVAGAIRYAYGRAAINGWRYDVVINLDDNSYRITCSEERSTVDRARDDDKAGAKRAFRKRDDEASPFEDASREQSKLESCSDAIVQDRKLERKVEFLRVQTARTEEPVDAGEVAIAIFPNGMIERSVIWLRGPRDRAYTLYLDEMTGRVRVQAGDEDPPDHYFEIEED